MLAGGTSSIPQAKSQLTLRGVALGTTARCKVAVRESELLVQHAMLFLKVMSGIARREAVM